VTAKNFPGALSEAFEAAILRSSGKRGWVAGLSESVIALKSVYRRDRRGELLPRWLNSAIIEVEANSGREVICRNS
jgi:hypothetical protein